jgi:hypothetical protein
MGLSAFGRFRVVRRLPPQVFLVRGQMKCDVSYEKKHLGIQFHFDSQMEVDASCWV